MPPKTPHPPLRIAREHSQSIGVGDDGDTAMGQSGDAAKPPRFDYDSNVIFLR